ncbi:MBOAT family protein [Zobellia sp.]|nr:MBOAT family protein [Zobellia sp.]
MLFNSIDFAIFLPIVFAIYWGIFNNNLKLQNIVLLTASYIFYGWWDWTFLSLIIFSSFVDFFVGQNLERKTDQTTRKRLLYLSIFINLGFLAFFKYYNFFADSFVSSFSFFGHDISYESLKIILPVGISFYTFQTLSYSIDVYNKKLKPSNDIIVFFTFVSFFPQLVAGPIERATNLLPQFTKSRKFSYDSLSYGFKLMIWGFFLKVVVADRASIYVNAIYNNIESHQGLSFISATFFFAFQIYGDFAGYSLIAIGTAKLFGFNLMTNFRRPYFSSSVSEFWTRWHISLSTWFRDYLYIPLGGNRVSKSRWLLNLFITFLISGLWHGANWTFVVWGALNGIYLILEVLLFKNRKKTFINILATFVLINFAWIFFRANSINGAFYIVKTIFTNLGELYIGRGPDKTAPIYALLAISILLALEVKREYFDSLFSISKHKNEFIRMGAYAILIFLILYLGIFDDSQFIYFQF